jgi:hypothetical protein
MSAKDMRGLLRELSKERKGAVGGGGLVVGEG